MDYFSEQFRHQNLCLTILVICVIVSTSVRLTFISSNVPESSWKNIILQNDAIKRTRYVYLFNWTNPTSVFYKNDTPIVQEIGPFVFKEIHNITEINWTGDKVLYKRRKEWVFLKNVSANIETRITNINVIFAVRSFRYS